VEIANAIEPAQDGRIYFELVNGAFLKAGGTPDQYRAGIERAIVSGWLWLHESGTYLKFTPAGAELFAQRTAPYSDAVTSGLTRIPDSSRTSHRVGNVPEAVR
jgi:hypothetical protein